MSGGVRLVEHQGWLINTLDGKAVRTRDDETTRYFSADELRGITGARPMASERET